MAKSRGKNGRRIWENRRVGLVFTFVILVDADPHFRLVNNAGVSLEAGRPRVGIHETDEDTWDVTMAVNVKSIFLGCKYVIAQMLRQEPRLDDDQGWIINMSSIMGLVAGRYNCEHDSR